MFVFFSEHQYENFFCWNSGREISHEFQAVRHNLKIVDGLTGLDWIGKLLFLKLTEFININIAGKFLKIECFSDN